MGPAEVFGLVEAFLGASPAGMKDAEAALLSAAARPGAAASFTEVALREDIAVEMRQLAALILRQNVVLPRWDEDELDEGAVPISAEEKAVVREMLPRGLASPVHRLRTAIALVVAMIGHADWPEAWPTLFDSLVDCVRGGGAPDGSPEQFYFMDGSMRCLSYFVEEISTRHILPAATALLPDVVRFLELEDRVSAKLRCRALVVAHSMLVTLHGVAARGPEEEAEVQELLGHFLPATLPVLAGILASPYVGPTQAGLKRRAVMVLSVLSERFPEVLTPLVNEVLLGMFGFMASLLPVYVRVTVEGDDLRPEETAPTTHRHEDDEATDRSGYDSEGDAQPLDSLVVELFGWLARTLNLRSKRARTLFKEALPRLAGLGVAYCQLAESDLEEYAEDPDLYVEDEDEDFSVDHDVRHSITDMLGDMIENFGTPALRAVTDAVMDRIHPEGASRGAALAWKMHEAAIFITGQVGGSIVHWWKKHEQEQEREHAHGGGGDGGGGGKKGKGGKKGSKGAAARSRPLALRVDEFATYLMNIISSEGASLGCQAAASFDGESAGPNRAVRAEELRDEDRGDPTHAASHLTGRAMWCATKISKGLNEEMSRAFLEAAMDGMRTERPVPVRLAACEAVARYCSRLPPESLVSFLPVIIDRATNLVVAASPRSIPHIVHTLCRAMQVHPDVAADATPRVYSLFAALWLAHAADPLIGPAASDALAMLVAHPNPEVVSGVGERLAPTILSILRSPDEMHQFVLGQTAVELARGLAERGPRPLPAHIFALFPVVLEVLATTEDHSLQESGADCLASFVYADPEQVLACRNESNGAPALDGLLVCIQRLLRWVDPKIESSTQYVGRLVLALAVQLSDRLDPELVAHLLTAVVTRMHTAELPTLHQQLLLVVAHFLATAPEPTIQLLMRVPLPPRALVIEAARHGVEDPTAAVLATHPDGVEPALVPVLRGWLQRYDLLSGEFSRKLSALALTKLLVAPGVLDLLSGVEVNGDPIVDASKGRKLRSSGEEGTSKGCRTGTGVGGSEDGSGTGGV